MDGRLIHALVGNRRGVGGSVKRLGCARAAASKVIWRCSTMAWCRPLWMSAGRRYPMPEW